jgi:hypothetical protein
MFLMTIEQKIKAFARLGDFLNSYLSQDSKEPSDEQLSEIFGERIQNALISSVHYNGWFTMENVKNSISDIAVNLTEKKLSYWLQSYKEELEKPEKKKKIGVIMAGNIPLAGFHDMLCVLLSGNIFIGKTSSQDKLHLPLLADILKEIEPGFFSRIIFTNDVIKDIDAVIATGSNNTSRYFEYYFGKYPHIIRKNRNSVAVLDGTETEEEIFRLGEDIFRYFGLGCRNVTKIYVPEDYDFSKLFKGLYDYQWLMNHNKYINNYHYNKTVYMMNTISLLDNNFLILKEDKALASPVGCLFYEKYKDKSEVEKELKNIASQIQCIVAKSLPDTETVNFGFAQKPHLWDYADGIDTMKFLLSPDLN